MPPPRGWREALAAVTPVAVTGTLLCCALPITLVALGAGTVMASLVATAPWITVLSRHKEIVFVGAGLLLLLDYRILFRSSSPVCRPGGVCHVSHPFGRWMRFLFYLSVLLYAVGVFSAWLLLPMAEALGFL